MGISWITAFKAVPWKDVVAAAPGVVQAARKLWGTGAQDTDPSAFTPPPGTASGPPDSTALDGRLRAIEQRTTELGREAATTAELVRSLAEQNARLVEAVGILQARSRLLAWLSCAWAVMLVAVVAWMAIR